MNEFDYQAKLWCVIDENGKFVGAPCLSSEEAYELSCQHKGSYIYILCYDWDTDPLRERFFKQ